MADGLPPAVLHALQLLGSPLGAVLFVPLYALWVTLLLPGIWASMLAGVLYGTALGTLVVFAGGCLGAIVVFRLGRSRWRGRLRRWLSPRPRYLAIERAVSAEGLRLVLLTRLSPLYPFSLLNLAYGLSDIRQRDYCIGLVGILPGSILFSALGSMAGEASRFGEVLQGEAGPGLWSVRVLGSVATIASLLLVHHAVRRALRGPEKR